MPAWGDILTEIGDAAKSGNKSAFDFVRRGYLQKLQALRPDRAVILYATKWTQSGSNARPDLVSISDEDVQGLMTVMSGVQQTKLDLIIHSPGGSIESAEALVTYLRSKFTDICVIVPQQAMSAATMIACAANSIMMGKHSFLGPTDPQFILNTELGPRVVTAQNIEEQFEQAKEECAQGPTKIAAWMPILRQFGPDMLQKCKNASALSRQLVAEWLGRYMFGGSPADQQKAKDIADWLSCHKHFKSHGRHLNREDLRAKGLAGIVDLEQDQAIQDAVLSIFHATTITFDGTAAVKLIENHSGKAFIRQMQQPVMQGMPQLILQPQGPKIVPAQPGQNPNIQIGPSQPLPPQTPPAAPPK